MASAALGAAFLLFGVPVAAVGTDKYQVLMPRPKQHSSGGSLLRFGGAEFAVLEAAARDSGSDTWHIVEAQLFQRLPPSVLSKRELTGSWLRVQFLHKLPDWGGSVSWQPSRERNETYGLTIGDGKLAIDAQSPWALANAMATLYQLFQITSAPEEISIPGCPHVIVDSPAFPHRGLLVDTSRTFYPVQWLQDLIVQLGQFKLNVLHLHLTDTAAWSFVVDAHPELSEHLSYRIIGGKVQAYSRQDVRHLVEFARRRGVSIVPEVDGPVHAPAMGSNEPLRLTVGASLENTNGNFGVEPPVGTWNFSSVRVMDTLKDVFHQLDEDFVTAPFLHAGGDEPQAAAVCAALTNTSMRLECQKECSDVGGSAKCKPMRAKPTGATGTYWFPDHLNEEIQGYFDNLVPKSLQRPVGAWSGVREDMAVELPSHEKPVLQLWQFPASGPNADSLTEDDCRRYDLIQSSATHPLNSGDHVTDQGWLYLECGEGQNWISMGKDYWCTRAPWAAIYSLNLTRHSSPAMASTTCQKAFLGAEIAIWGEITGPGNAMSLIFPRAVAFAERSWTNPAALSWEELAANGSPPGQYWHDHLKGALHRLNAVVENFALQGIDSARLQPKFCFDHPEYCDQYTEQFEKPDFIAV
eukprot:TRINITY_DN2472_c0_g1_i6.p1 TRINITY_DN2472_c0_g1~~TRINITY_DN2472_c0_g1_i6.p1  ORF type:complete len:674 (+),score=74.91 TRINITY_DN2472_c0_g1_i6:113-2023(+)